MRGASRAALAASVERYDSVAGGLEGLGLGRLSDELFAVLHVVDGEAGLRRSLSDPTRDASAKSEVARVLFEGKISSEALGLVQTVASQRWSRGSEMADAVEYLAVLAQVGRASADGSLDDLEDELFRFGRIVEAQPDLRAALANAAVPADGKRQVVESLLGGRATGATVRLLVEVAANPRGRSPERGIATIGRIVSERRKRLVALVRSAVALDAGEKDRLAAALAGIYGSEVQIKAEVDPTVVGGLTVQVGDELIDGTIAGRLDRLKRRFER